MSWNELTGVAGYLTGANGTFTVPAGAKVLQIIVVAGVGAGTMTIFGGASIPIPAAGGVIPFRFPHLLQTSIAGAQDIVTTATGAVFIEYVK